MIRPLEITSLSKSFQTPTGPYVAVADFSMKIAPGEFVSIVGHSGCGKSTVLSILAGLQNATLGGFCIDGIEVIGPGTDRGVVFQSPCLLPWKTAQENVVLALAQVRSNTSDSELRRLALRFLQLAGVENCANQLPGELSQGTQQRVSIARALALEPRFLLLDEPFGMLDSLTRFELQEMLLELWETDRKTVVMVTHDVDEALYLSDRIVLMTDGPGARIGEILTVPFARPRDRVAVLESTEYYRLHARIIDFLENHSAQFAA